MRHPPLILAIWPGLPGLVRHGRWSFLAIALGFGFVASAVLFVCGCWSEIIPPESKWWLYGGTAAVWLIFSFLAGELSVFFDRRLLFDARGDRFLELLGRYLAGEWSDAETAARSILKRNGKDPETLLLLATLYRHTGRIAEATETLAQLKRLETAARWSREIALEEAALREPPQKKNDLSDDLDDASDNDSADEEPESEKKDSEAGEPDEDNFDGDDSDETTLRGEPLLPFPSPEERKSYAVKVRSFSGERWPLP